MLGFLALPEQFCLSPPVSYFIALLLFELMAFLQDQPIGVYTEEDKSPLVSLELFSQTEPTTPEEGVEFTRLVSHLQIISNADIRGGNILYLSIRAKQTRRCFRSPFFFITLFKNSIDRTFRKNQLFYCFPQKQNQPQEEEGGIHRVDAVEHFLH